MWGKNDAQNYGIAKVYPIWDSYHSSSRVSMCTFVGKAEAQNNKPWVLVKRNSGMPVKSQKLQYNVWIEPIPATWISQFGVHAHSKESLVEINRLKPREYGARTRISRLNQVFILITSNYYDFLNFFPMLKHVSNPLRSIRNPLESIKIHGISHENRSHGAQHLTLRPPAT